MANNLAYYIRLSLADGDLGTFKDESNSVKNQRDLILKYIDTHPEFSGWNMHEFVDDGYTGTNDERPDFQRLMDQAGPDSMYYRKGSVPFCQKLYYYRRLSGTGFSVSGSSLYCNQ